MRWGDVLVAHHPTSCNSFSLIITLSVTTVSLVGLNTIFILAQFGSVQFGIHIVATILHT